MRWILFVFACCVMSCKSSNSLQSNTVAADTDIQLDKNCTWNDSKSHSLCIKKTELSKANVTSSVEYWLNDNDNVKIYEGSIRGTVKWLNDSAIVIFQVPGTMRSGETRDDYKKVYDLKSSEWIKYTEFNLKE